MASNHTSTPTLINGRIRLSQQQSSFGSSGGSPANSPLNKGTLDADDDENVFRYDEAIIEEEQDDDDEAPYTSPPPVPDSKPSTTVTIVQQKPPTLFTNNRQQQQQLSPPQPVALRDPSLSETIRFLMHWSGLVRSNAAAYLAHLCFIGDDTIKAEARTAIPLLVELLLSDERDDEMLLTRPASSVALQEQYKNICSALRNLTYRDDESKRILTQAGGVTALGRLYAYAYALIPPQIQTDGSRIESSSSAALAAVLCEIVSAILWNVSSCAEIRNSIVDEALQPILGTITDLPTSIIALLQKQQTDETAPYEPNSRIAQSQRNQTLRFHNQQLLRQFQTKTFCNVSGVLRNVSCVDEEAVRKAVRGGDDGGVLLRALFAYLRIVCVTAAVGDVDDNVRNDGVGIINGKSTENCVCIIRNITYRLQEIDDQTYAEKFVHDGVGEVVYSQKSHYNITHNKKKPVQTTISDTNSTFKVEDEEREKDYDDDDIYGPDIICVLRKPKTRRQQKTELANSFAEVLPSAAAARQVDMLWSNDAVKCCLAILRQCTNSVTLEAAAGAIQNLTACAWRPTLHVRALVRKEKGLPILIELLRMDNDRVVMSVARALRNLALDEKNRELIGKYAMNDLMAKIPSAQQRPSSSAPNSDETITAILATLNETIASNQEFARIFVEHDGLAKLVRITQQQPKEPNAVYGPRTVRFTTYILHTLWRRHTKLRDLYKTFGFKESQLLAVSREREPQQQLSNGLLKAAASQRRRRQNHEDKESKHESTSLLTVAEELKRQQAQLSSAEAAAEEAIEAVEVTNSVHEVSDDEPPKHHAPLTRHQYTMATSHD